MKYLLLFFLLPAAVIAQIRVSDNHRYLATADGQPFFWLGDTDWEMAHRLTREEISAFIATRASQGFNVLQVVALAEFNGIRQPNRYGDWPLNNEDPTQLAQNPGNRPDNDYEYDYWDHLEYIIETAGAHHMYIGLLPTWGDKVTQQWGEGPVLFNEATAEVYATTLARRYQRHQNIIWILGGDRPAIHIDKRDGVEKKQDDRTLWRAMASGIEHVAGTTAFITYHPSGGSFSTSQYIHEDPWLDLNAFQSGHGARETDAWNWVARDLALQPLKPTLDMEPCYEDHPVNPWDGKWTRKRGYFHAPDVRARIYRTIFAGACGVTYGHHQVWQFLQPERYPPINIGDTTIGWQRAATAEAATQLQYLKALMLSRPYFDRVPDQSVLLSNGGSNYQDYIAATRATDGSYAMIYLPQSRPVKVDLSKISGSKKRVWWFDPRSGKASVLKEVSGRSGTFAPPVGGTDWVLVIDDAAKKFPAPGAH